jgi:sugar O-acyltransferase (sialic acid O-acetyltransferase NeuD family)
MEQRVVILGGPAEGSIIAEALTQARAAGAPLCIGGFLNDRVERGDTIYGFPVFGRLDDWRELDEDVRFAWALQKVGAMPQRVERLENLGIPDHRWISVRHPQSFVASSVEVGIGSFIASFVTVQPMARIGRFASLRGGANLGHHCQLGDHAYVGPNASLLGYARMETGACLGGNAVLMARKTLGAFAIAGIGSAVTKDVPAGAVVFGSPARQIRVIPQSAEQQPVSAEA